MLYRNLKQNLSNKFNLKYIFAQRATFTCSQAADLPFAGRSLPTPDLRETQGILILFFNSGKLNAVLDFSKNFREILRL